MDPRQRRASDGVLCVVKETSPHTAPSRGHRSPLSYKTEPGAAKYYLHKYLAYNYFSYHIIQIKCKVYKYMLITLLFSRSFLYMCKWRDWLWGQREKQGDKKRPKQVCCSCLVKHLSLYYKTKVLIISSLLVNRDVQKDSGKPRVPVVCLERLKILVSQLPPHGRRQSDPLPTSRTEKSETLRNWQDATPEVCII